MAITEQTVMAVIRASRPNFRNPHDKVAFAVHATFLASGYILHAAGPSAFPPDALSSVSTQNEVGIDNWNQLEDEYAFIYSNPDQGSKKVLVKCLKMNDQLQVDCVSDDGSEPVHLEIRVEDYDRADGGNNSGSQYKDMQKLLSAINKELVIKLSTRSAAQPSSSTERSSLRSRNIEVDERSPSEPYSPTGYVFPPINPVGGGDLYPGMFPARYVFPPINPVGGGDLYPGMFTARGDAGTGGGMFVGPDHPMFGGQGIGRGHNFPGGIPGVPEGARFDPYGPPGVPGFEPNRFTRNPRQPGRGPHPDLQHFHDGADYI